MRRLLTGARVFTGDSIVVGHAVLIDGERITAVVPEAEAPADARVQRLPGDTLLVPGFLDLQVNGAGGVLFNDTPTAEAALTIAAVARRTGTTGVLPTLMTDERGKIQLACDAVVAARRRPAGGVLGLHLEGPFLSPERPGVHSPQWIRSPEPRDIELLVALAGRLSLDRRSQIAGGGDSDGDAGGARVVPRGIDRRSQIAGGIDRGRLLLTLAPECIDDRDLARLAAAGITLSAGHTAATVERTRSALAAGVRGFTHLFNAMPPVINREPGPVAAALADRDAWCSVIADGLHVHPALLRLLVQVKPPGKVFLVTDAMPTSGTDATSFTLFGRTILRHSGRLVTEDGTLAGADIDMAASVRNCVHLLDLSLEESLRMASLYPASYLGLDDQLGRVAPGYRADLALLHDDLSVLATWVGDEDQWCHDARDARDVAS